MQGKCGVSSTILCQLFFPFFIPQNQSAVGNVIQHYKKEKPNLTGLLVSATRNEAINSYRFSPRNSGLFME